MHEHPRIVVVEDERAMREMLVLALEREGYRVRALATGADAPRAQFSPDWFKLISTLTTVVSVVLVAIFTAIQNAL